MGKKIVVGIGEALWDLLPAGKKVGGAPANFAYHASQFGFDAYAVSALGADALGDELLGELEEAKMNLIMPRVDFPTGTVAVTLDASGIPSYEICTGVAWDNIPFSAELEALAKKTDVVCFGSLAQRNAVSRDTINRFLDAMPDTEDTLKVFDINLRQHFFDKDIVENSLKKCNILKLNDEEIDVVNDLLGFGLASREEICRKLLENYGLKIVILTCGAVESLVFTENETSVIPTPKGDVVDTVGAGDSFTGAFVAGIVNGLPLSEAHALAVKVAYYVCTKPGAMPAYTEDFAL